MTTIESLQPGRRIAVREVFGFASPLVVHAFAGRDEHVPEVDPACRFNPRAHTRHPGRVRARPARDGAGPAGSGKSTHVEQAAARLNWPCGRINLDGHISRLDLVGRDAVVLRDGQQVTGFQAGILPWALQRPVALIFDECRSSTSTTPAAPTLCS